MSVTIKIILKRKFTLSPHKFDSLRSTLPKDYREKNKTIRKRLYAQAAENEYRERNKWGLEGPTENPSSQLESKHVSHTSSGTETQKWTNVHGNDKHYAAAEAGVGGRDGVDEAPKADSQRKQRESMWNPNTRSKRSGPRKVGLHYPHNALFLDVPYNLLSLSTPHLITRWPHNALWKGFTRRRPVLFSLPLPSHASVYL